MALFFCHHNFCQILDIVTHLLQKIINLKWPQTSSKVFAWQTVLNVMFVPVVCLFEILYSPNKNTWHFCTTAVHLKTQDVHKNSKGDSTTILHITYITDLYTLP